MTDRERTVLGIAGQRWKHAGAKAEAIRAQLGMSEAQFAQVLTVLIERADAEAEMPQLVYRLRRLATGRRAARVR